jgi:hypothetical protein
LEVTIIIFIIAAAGIAGVLGYAVRHARPPSQAAPAPNAEQRTYPQSRGSQKVVEQKEPVTVVRIHPSLTRQPTYRVQRIVSLEMDDTAIQNIQPPDNEFRL